MRPSIRKFTSLLAGVSIVFFTFAFANSAASQSWTSTGSMNHARFGHTTTRLPDGKIPTPQVGPPTNKDQCKNGGWQTFNTPRAFENQGDCIQFVNTGK